MKVFFKSLATAVVILLAGSCMIMDWTPVKLRIYVENQAGEDLLDPDSEINMLEGVTMTYRGETYELVPEPETKYYLPHFDGLQLMLDEDGRHYLYFGELDGAEEYNDDFTLAWGDATSDVIHYKRNIFMTAVSEKWKLNGAKSDMPMTIVK